MKPLLTIGMATFGDFEGCWMTLQALKLYHLIEDDIELLVIDNAPKSCQSTKQVTKACQGRYLHMPTPTGTSAPRDRVFQEAAGEMVCCMDSHVLLARQSVGYLMSALCENPRDLVQGVMVYDWHGDFATHFEPVWSDGMWGVWQNNDPRGRPGRPPFEIPMQGLGLFAMNKAAWPGFNPKFRGFGGEEGYLHEKVRQRGGRCVCVPGIRWLHRFSRPNGVPYSLRTYDRIFNYLVGHEELGLDPAPIIKHFTELGFCKELEAAMSAMKTGEHATAMDHKLPVETECPAPESINIIGKTVPACAHKNFEATTSVNRTADSQTHELIALKLEISMKCKDCGQNIKFARKAPQLSQDLTTMLLAMETD